MQQWNVPEKLMEAFSCEQAMQGKDARGRGGTEQQVCLCKQPLRAA